jgi:ribosomal protein S18 acetylase RimI-like enzyme
MSVWGGVRSGLAWVPCRLGPAALLRLARYYATKKELRAARVERDHWYLFLLAVDPRRHGRSIGRRLIEHGLARVDRESQSCYLETSREENLAYFERFGFEVNGERVVTEPGGAGPRVWGMVRRPDSGA